MGSELFFNTSPVADKFYIIRSLMESCQDVRVRLRQELLRDRRSIRLLKEKLRDWMKKVEQDDVDEMLNFKSLIERNLMPVLNYFRFGATNAIAENINSRIQRFISINQGVRDREFFYFRMKKYFS